MQKRFKFEFKKKIKEVFNNLVLTFTLGCFFFINQVFQWKTGYKNDERRRAGGRGGGGGGGAGGRLGGRQQLVSGA